MHFPNRVIKLVMDEGEKWKNLYFEAKELQGIASIKADELNPLSQYLDSQADIRSDVRINGSLVVEMRKLNALVE